MINVGEMMHRRRIWLVVVVLALALGAGVAAPRVRHWLVAPPAGYCPICLRHEHKESLVKFQAQGERPTDACCLRCALTYGQQTGKAVTILSVTEHDSGKSLDPERATFVIGSDVSPCTHTMVQMGAEKQAYPVRWDRCLPSTLAFSSRESAEAFRLQHGGRLRRLQELRQEVGTREPSG
jgi:hypothetical protein